MKVGGLLSLLIVALLAAAYINFGTIVTNGRVVEAQVLHVEMRPVARFAGDDLPILTVRLADGSTREVQATWADVNDCKPGRSIALVQHGTALHVGKPGCRAGH